jgi:topoisomerase-4 subunit B
MVQLTVEDPRAMEKMMDMLLSKKRAADRKSWLEDKGDLASV